LGVNKVVASSATRREGGDTPSGGGYLGSMYTEEA